MKAKEQAKMFLEKCDAEVLTTILNDYGKELINLSAVRNISTTTAFKNIFDELQNKFLAFCKLTNYRNLFVNDFETKAKQSFDKFEEDKKNEICIKFFKRFMDDWIELQDVRMRSIYRQSMNPISRVLY